MNKTIKIAIGSLLLIVAPMSFACDYPERPNVPDGSTASKEELLAAKDDVATYLAGVDDYLTCIETAEKEAIAALAEEASTDDLKRRDAMLSSKFDAANEEKALVGEEFNLEVRAYNAARQADD